MKAKDGIIDLLNKLLTANLTAINQYFVHAKMCENWGYERLHHKVCERSFAEMKDAEEIIEHILYLEGVPNMQRLGTVQVGETVPEQFKLDLKAEQEMLKLYTEGVTHCAKVGRLYDTAQAGGHAKRHRCAHRLDRDPTRVDQPSGAGEVFG